MSKRLTLRYSRNVLGTEIMFNTILLVLSVLLS